MIRGTFAAIHGSIAALEVAEKVPLPDDPTVRLDHGDLLAFERDGLTEHPVRLSDGTVRRVDIRRLLDGVTAPEQRRDESRPPREGEAEPARRDGPDETGPVDVGPTRPPHDVAKWERPAAFASAIVFLLLLLGIALVVPDPTHFQLRVFQVVLALAAGGFDLLLSGQLGVENRRVKATGAAAFFVIVYFINPAALVTEAPPPEETETSQPADDAP